MKCSFFSRFARKSPHQPRCGKSAGNFGRVKANDSALFRESNRTTGESRAGVPGPQHEFWRFRAQKPHIDSPRRHSRTHNSLHHTTTNFNNGLHCLHFHRLRRGPQGVQGPGACRRSKSAPDPAKMRGFSRTHEFAGMTSPSDKSRSASPSALRRRFIRVDAVNPSDVTSSRRIRAFSAVRGARASPRARTRVGFVGKKSPSRRLPSSLPDRI